MKTRILLAGLVALVVIESTILALPYVSQITLNRVAPSRTYYQSVSFPFSVFNRPISNDTETELDPGLLGSWEVDLQSSLVPSSGTSVTEAEIALAPAYPIESKSIPTIIVQERSDGLVRIEYFAQSWPNTTGLLLYNSSMPGWKNGNNIDILFHSTGPPSEVNPQLAPKPNGNIDITVRGATVVSSYPIAWANLSDLYLYGYPGSSFTSGALNIGLYELV